MPVEISVGPPVLTINQGNMFMVTDLGGEITSDSEMGVFAHDTRFLSYYAISANGEPWERLSSATSTYYAAKIYLTNRQFSTEDGDVQANTISLIISREISNGISERLEVSNYGLKPVRFNLEIALRSDFADIFEVRAHKFVRRGRIDTDWDGKRSILKMSYANKDFYRHFIYRILVCGAPAHFANGRITYELSLAPGTSWHLASRYELISGEKIPKHPDHKIGDETQLDKLQHAWHDHATKLTSANEEIYRLYRQSVDDMGGLRLYDEGLDPDRFLPAAGVPWYVTLFGRDSLIVSLQNMLVNSRFALGTLEGLAKFQAKEDDAWRDADPGKILHEIRFGELAHFGKIPHTPYYGTADATALFLIVLHEAWKWLGDKSILKKYKGAAEACLNWIDNYGDLDGDGFQEYKTRSEKGYENMCWKDSFDSIVYADGSQVKQPKAVCELQGYAYDARCRMAEVFEALGDKNEAAALRKKAKLLKKRFNEKFWVDDLGFFALALDPEKKPVKSVASNVGHCLWSGIVDEKYAEQTVKRLMEADMQSGWGTRTLSSRHPAYNPFSYHCGSVWPHDNGIIALGFKRYGFTDEAARIARDISETASFFVSHRIPELYAGVDRRHGSFPVQYPGANVPQAWAAGAVFHLLQAILGIQADAPNGKLYVDPVLPKWLPQLKLDGIAVGDSVINLQFWLDDGKTCWDASVTSGKINVTEKSWQVD
jgi:glycogen debranching enzyme